MKIGIINLGINNIKSVKDFFSLFGDTYILNHSDDFILDTQIMDDLYATSPSNSDVSIFSASSWEVNDSFPGI